MSLNFRGGLAHCDMSVVDEISGPFKPQHTVNSGSEMVEAKHVSGKNIFWSTLTVKSRGGKIFEFVHCPFEGRANMHHKIQPKWLTGRCCLTGGSKGGDQNSRLKLNFRLKPVQNFRLKNSEVLGGTELSSILNSRLFKGHRTFV